MHTLAAHAPWVLVLTSSLGLALGCTDSTSSLDGLGNLCDRSTPCNDALECFRGVCVPIDDEPGSRVDAGPGSRIDAGPGPGPLDGGSVTQDGGARPSEAWFSGSSPLIAVFPSNDEIIVVDETNVYRLAPDGRELARYSPGRVITAAATDGVYIGVADRARLTSLDFDLVEQQQSDLVRFCESAVVLSEHRFVCGPENDWDRVFATFDLSTGMALGDSSPYTYNGIPMRRVPGQDSFVTVTVNLSPSDFHLYELGGNSEAVFVNESPYHGDIVATAVYAFDGSPAQHLVNAAGEILQIRGDDCVVGSPYRANCFVRAGDLGVLPRGAYYRAMVDDGAGRLYTLRSQTDYYRDPLCSSEIGCTLEVIDFELREVQQRIVYSEPVAGIEAFELDAARNRLLLAQPVGQSDPWTPATGYRIDPVPL